MVTSTLFRPSESQVVLVVAATDVDAVEAKLRPLWRERLCVIVSRYSRSELDSTSRSVRAWPRDWAGYSVGETTDEHGQPVLDARLTRMLPEVVAWHRTQPTGIIDIYPWLVPTRVAIDSLEAQAH